MFKSKVNYRSFLDSIGVPLMSLTKDWRIDYVNEAYSDWVERSVAGLEGRKLLELFPETVGTPSYAAYLQVFETKQSKCIQFEVRGKNYRQNIYPVNGGLVTLIQESDETRVGTRLMEHDYKEIFNEINDALFLFDVFSNKIIDANKPACKMLGYSYAEILQLTIGDLSAEESPFTKENLINWLKKVASNNPQTQMVEWLTKDKSGRIFWVELKSKSTYYGDREHLLIILRDITEIKESQRRLRESSDRYLDLFENSGDLIYVHDLDGNFLRVNKVMERVSGYWREELLNMNIEQLVSPDNKDIHQRYTAFGQRMAQQKKGKHRPVSYEIEILTKHGLKVYLEVSTWLVYKNHEPIAVQGIARDISARKMEEQSLKDSQQMMVDLIEYLPDPVMAIDIEGKVIIWNNAMEELTGFEADQMLGKGNYEYSLPFYGKRRPVLIDLVLRPDDIERNYTTIKQEHYVLTASVEVPALRGESRTIWCKAVPLYDRNGELLGAVESIREMTEFQRIQDAERSFG